MPRGSAATTASEDLFTVWQALIGKYCATAQAAQTGQALLASWSEPHRGYHNITHLRDVLLHIDELEGHAVDPDAVRLAAWYHDVIYRGLPDDEENSALRAETELDALGLTPALVQEVARLVRLTASHNPATGDRNGETLCDADLAILAAPPEQYAVYTATVRAEYAHIPDEFFRPGRANILRALVDDTGIYRTPHGRKHWETAALANVTREISDLTSTT